MQNKQLACDRLNETDFFFSFPYEKEHRSSVVNLWDWHVRMHMIKNTFVSITCCKMKGKKRSTKGKNISQYFYFAVAINVKVKSTYIHISSSLFYTVMHVIRKMCNFHIHFADTPSIGGTNYSVNIIEWLQNEKNGLFTYLFYKLNIHIHTKSTICWNYKKAQKRYETHLICWILHEHRKSSSTVYYAQSKMKDQLYTATDFNWK